MNIIENNIQKLFASVDGGVVCDMILSLKKKCTEDNRDSILLALMQYAVSGNVLHMRQFAVSTLVDLVKPNESEYSIFFKKCIESGDESKQYWGIKGYCKVTQKKSYEYIVKYIFSKETILEHKALIIKEISKLSNNPFDQGKPYECNEWKEEDIEYNAIQAWCENGFPDGKGYKEPPRHTCLDNPASPEEKLYSRLDKKLLKKREKKQDLANPSNWLVTASQEDMLNIKKRWTLPTEYMDFLEKASPLNAAFSIKGYGRVEVYGAHNLIAGQNGYSYNPSENKKIKDWNTNYVVVANRFGDPFCIDISIQNSPVYFAFHGLDKWEFTKEFESILDFLKSLK